MKRQILGWITAIIFCGVFFTLASCEQIDNPASIVDPVIDPEEKLDDVEVTDTKVLEYSLFGQGIPYVRVNYTYYSVASDGVTPTKLSSALVFPTKVYKHQLQGDYDAEGLILVAHFTIASNSEAPTQAEVMKLEGPLCTLSSMNGKNYILVVPDLIGFGVTKDQPQAYMMADVTARQEMDGLEAAKKVLKLLNYTYGPRQVLVGYSQGGHTVMAINRMLSRTSVVQPFDISCAGGGPYDLAGMVDSILKPGAKTKYPCAIPLLFVGTNDAAGLGMDYKKVFPEAIGEKMVNWIRSKEMSTTEINDSICYLLNAKLENGIPVSELLNMDYVKRENSDLDNFFSLVEDNTLLSGWKPISGSHYYIYHSVGDEVVPYFCYEHMSNFMKATGDTSLVIDYEKSYGKHVEAASAFVLEVISKLVAM